MIESACKEAELPLVPFEAEDNLELYNPVLSVAMNVVGMSIVYGGMPLLRSGVCGICFIQNKHNTHCETEECGYSYQDACIPHAIKEEVAYYQKIMAVNN